MTGEESCCSWHSSVQNPAATLHFTLSRSQGGFMVAYKVTPPQLPPLFLHFEALSPAIPSWNVLPLAHSLPSSQLKSHFPKEAYLDSLPHSCSSDPIYPAFTFPPLYLAFLPYAVSYLFILFAI